MVLRSLVLVYLGLLATLAAAADVPTWRKHTHGDLVAETTAVAPGQSATVGLRISLADKWHTYWINPGDSGTPIRLSFDNGAGVRVTRVQVPMPRRFENGPLITFGYVREVLFPIELEIDSSLRPGQNAHVRVEAEWLVCEDICIPALDQYELDVPVRALAEVKPSPYFSEFQRARARVPQPRETLPRVTSDGRGTRLTFAPLPDDRDFVDYFPFKNSGVTNEAPHVSVAADGALTLALATGNVARARPERVGVLVTRLKQGGRLEAWQYGESGWTFEERRADPGATELWWMLLSAFVGGLILNLMPCVFPILSIKLLSLLKLAAANPRAVRAQNGAYVLGVLASFLSIALTLSGLRSAGHLIGWGFQLQSPLFLSVLAWLFFALSLNLLGLFEIEWLGSGFGQRLTRFDGAWGSFFTGVLAVVVASPCTAPFMGVALGFGLAQPTVILIATFVSLGLGLAFPYLIFTVKPTWIRILPKPGRWMTRVKQLMAFPLLATDLWLIWVLGQVRGPNAMVVVLAGCVVLGGSLWFARVYRRRAAVLAVLLLVTGLIYVGRDEQYAQQAAASEVWKAYSPALLESLRGKNVFVNVTADWCLTCKVNERLVFNDAEVLGDFAAHDVVMLKGDWTQRNPDLTRYLNRFARVGVPFYVMYSPRHPNGLILPELLTKGALRAAIAAEYP